MAICALVPRAQFSAFAQTVAHQSPLSMGFPRREYWSRLLFPSPGLFPTEELNPHLLCLLDWPGGFFTS